MKPNNPYIPPQSDLSNAAGSDKKKATFLRKFLYSLCFSFGCFLLVVLFFTPKDGFNSGVIGSLAFAIVSGFISGVIPSQKKRFYIPAGFILMFIAAAVIGSLYL